MTTQKLIDKNRTDTLIKGDKVVMHTCIEATLPNYKDKIWVCETDSYLNKSTYEDIELVFLKGFSGCFATKFLTLIKV